MQIEISCELYARMAAIALLTDPRPEFGYCKSLFIERKLGSLFVMATNVKICAVQYLGRNEGPDEYTAIVIDPILIKQCQNEIEFNGILHIVATPQVGFTTIKTTMGYSYPGNGMVMLPDGHNLKNWRDWFTEPATATAGAMFWNTAVIEAIAKASPSGGIVFPEFIDTSKFVLINDRNSSDWIAIFNPTTSELDDAPVIPASLPDWKL